MCGIAGTGGFSDLNLLHRMSDTLVHRGPDDEGFYFDDRVGLAVRRLSIIDLGGGRQPIHNEDETVWVALNGEVYNYVELRAELVSRGHKFYTASDTETIVHLYEDCGESFVGRLRGMFAVALWDAVRGKLILARDRFGKKPLFYCLKDGSLIFGSEVKSILQFESIEPTLNLDAIRDFMTFFYIPSPSTAFESIYKLPPSSYAVFQNGHFEVKPYWDLRYGSAQPCDLPSLLSKLDERLKEAVRIRLRSDVPVGLFLSGGIDSSTVSALACRLMGGRVKTFSVGFSEPEYDESHYAMEVAEFLGTDHHEITVGPDKIDLLPKLVWHFDEPFADPSAIPTYEMSLLASRHVKVVLSGDGGDELFMGYPWLTDFSILRHYSKIPQPIRSSLLYATRLIPSSLKRGLIGRAAALVDYERHGYTALSPEWRYLARVSKVSEEELKGGLTESISPPRNGDNAASVISFFQKARTEGLTRDFLSEADYVTIKTYLVDDILVKVDRTSMACSLEVRCPLLDHELAELVAGVPAAMKMRNGETKILLKRYVTERGILPASIALRRKQGFGVPLEYWFGRELPDLAKSLLLDRGASVRRYFKPHFIQSCVKAANSYTGAGKTYALMMLEIWHRIFIDERNFRSPNLDLNRFL